MRRSWIVERWTDGYQRWWRCVAVEGDGKSEEIGSHYARHWGSYFVVYEGERVPYDLCQCRFYQIEHGLRRLVHVYSWADAPWVPFIMWGA